MSDANRPGPTQQLRAESPIKPGTVLEDGTVVGEYIGRSSGALNFYGERPEAGRVVIKVLAPALDEPLAAHHDAIESFLGTRHASLQALLGRGRIGPRNYLVYEYIDGQSLRSTLDQVSQAGGAVDMETTLHLVVQASQALEVLHTVTAHGVVTCDNLFLERDGRLRVANIGFGRLAFSAANAAETDYANTAYIAPEVREDPWHASEASDVFSLGVLLVSLLAGHDPPRDGLDTAAAVVCQRHPELIEVVQACLADEPVMRLQSMRELRQLLREHTGLEASGLMKVPTEEDDLKELLGGIDLPDAPTLGFSESTSTDPERWITRIDGRDFGPYTSAGVRELLTSDQIDEHTPIVDLFTQDVADLIDVSEFTDFVMEYLPERAKRRIAAQERREEVVKQAKRTGATTIVASVLAVAAGAALLIYTQVDSPPVPFGDYVQPFRFTFEVQEPTYVEIQADDALIASLFDFSDPVPDEPEPSRGRSDDGGSRAADEPEPSLDDYVLSFDGSRPARKLTSEEINGTIARNQSSVQRCFQRELRANPRFQGVTVSWSIVPDGRTTNIRIEEHGEVTDEARSCLRRAFRSMRFPEFNDVPMNVSIPFRLQ